MAAKDSPLHRESTALGVREPQASIAELLAQDTVLLLEVRDDLELEAVAERKASVIAGATAGAGRGRLGPLLAPGLIALPTTLPGVILLELAAGDDARGWLVEIYRRDRYAALGIAVDFVQGNARSTVGGALRGLHYQRLRPQGKLVQVTWGEVFDVAVDVRRGSPTLGAWFGTVLSADNRRQLWILPGFAHGFVALSARADLSYKLTDYHAPDDGRAIEHVADRPGHDRRYTIEPARLEAELGWRPAIPFARGLRDTIAWYLARPAWPA